MSLEARRDLFGDASELLVQEAVWFVRESDGDWPTEDELVDELAKFSEVESATDARGRLDRALADGEVTLELGDDAWLVRISEETYDAITRRYMDRTMPRRNKEESWDD
jgi:hypothetical protein